MPVESLQCPKCGSPLEADTSGGFVYCNYCGSRLRVTRGASGHALGVLDEIKSDADILARETAIKHLQQRLPGLYQQRDALVQESQSYVRTAQAVRPKGARAQKAAGLTLLTVCALFALLSVCALAVPPSAETGSSQASPASVVFCCLVPSLALAGTGGLVWRQAGQRERKAWQLAVDARGLAEDKYRPAIAAVEEEIRSTQARIAELRAEMDRLVKGL